MPHLQVSDAAAAVETDPNSPLLSRIRKIKCDESRPACQRCASTGRVCPGYGIWGGGASCQSNSHRLVQSNEYPRVHRALVSVLASTAKERESFEWFKCRTSPKIPGSFVSSFWNTLLLQASLSEPAVLHAVLALSSIHRRGIDNGNGQTKQGEIPDEQEQFALQQYVKAIGHLQPHLLDKDRVSFRIALMTCVVFISLELLRGHFRTATTHLENGYKILQEMQMLYNGAEGFIRLKSCRESTDEWIIEAFFRLQLQVELFRHGHEHPYLVVQTLGPAAPVLVFRTHNEAWIEMERLINQIFYMTHQSRQRGLHEPKPTQQSTPLLGQQRHLRTELGRWLDMYELLGRTEGGKSEDEEKRHQLLYVYHTMATIMAETCLQPGNELAYDSYTPLFLLLMTQLVKIWGISPLQRQSRHVIDMSRSVVDIGAIPPLYYLASKCRVHRIRLHAIKLLESSSHREGIWDSPTAACVARKTMEIEENDFYRDFDTVDEFSLDSLPRPQDLLLPALPESCRIREVELGLMGAPMDTILLFCKKMYDGKDCRVLLSEYNVDLHRWTDRYSEWDG